MSERARKRRNKYWLTAFNERIKQLPDDISLSADELREASKLWQPYSRKVRLTPLYLEFYKKATGTFDPRLIPDDIYYTVFDPFFNDWPLACHLDNKTFYPIIFHDIRQPETLFCRQNGFWKDSSTGAIMAQYEVLSRLEAHSGYFVKVAQESEGGAGVIFIGDTRASIEKLKQMFVEIKRDIIIQAALRQSPTLARINASSVNTIRILTLLRPDGSVKICSAVLRMGIKGAKVDNASSGGIVVGIGEDGRLKPLAYSAAGKRFDRHPTSLVRFDDFVIPNFDEVKRLAISQAPRFPHFRLISWDIALDEHDRPTLIEANLKYGELEFHQLCNGPVFGRDTEEILREALSGKLPTVQ